MVSRDDIPDIPVYARCSAGIGRWFWVAWESDAEARAGAPARACGHEKSAAAAEKKAIETIGPEARLLPSRWASGYRRGGVARREDGARTGIKMKVKIPSRFKPTRPGR